MLEEKKQSFRGVAEKVGNLFSHFGMPPNFYTLLSIGFSVSVLILLIRNQLVYASIFFAAAILLDFVDGALARATAQETSRGAYLDTVADRYVEGLTLLGFLFLPLPDYFFSAHVWVVLAMFGGLMTSYVKAAAVEKKLVERELWAGFFGRPERALSLLVAMIAGIFDIGLMTIILIIIAVATNITAWQRILIVIKR